MHHAPSASAHDFIIAPRFLYLHWPFCPYKCHFCSFIAIAGHDEFKDQYHAALQEETVKFLSSFSIRPFLETIFIGGGTPSTYPPELLKELFAKIRYYADLSPHAELSLEVNPGTITPERIAAWQECGINRISLGVQSLKTEVLVKLNRLQATHHVFDAIDKLSRAFPSLSIDLILGLPDVTPDEWRNLLNLVVRWPIQHISLYFLTIHEQTPLYYGVMQKKVVLPCDEEIVDLYHWSVEYLAVHNFQQYEISNFSKPGFHSRHNSAYWSRAPFKGCGLGASSFNGTCRMINEKNLLAYIKRVEEGTSTVEIAEQLTPQQAWLEQVMLGVRQTQGVSIEVLCRELSEEKLIRFKAQINYLVEQKLVLVNNGMLMLTPQARAVENEVVMKLTEN